MDSGVAVGRVIGRAAQRSVAAVAARDAEAYEGAAVELAARNPEQVGLVLGGVVRMLLEEVHPDGLDSDDLQVVLKRCAVDNIGWFPELDPTVLVLLLTAALGVHPSEEEAPRVEPAAMARHAPLLVADLLAVTRRPLADYLDASLAEIFVVQTNELP
ncbi:hypothetical protein [Micromonospora sp. NBC_01796]|uniref:hypothetical protein n=1 Tax=Micromonospora sp. NBC_01796 TaxID=2975987 RepID=UPI002DDACAC9|nr:hypothetical protein [Micromonospora sp. NBC_01796]WSA88030.1 hypothetical protein OIE47_10685 [Micromonospora sp. NBC_01796]